MASDTALDGEVRDDWIPKGDYITREFAALEEQKLWPHVWQLACREEELPNPGDFVTYDIAEESIIVVRSTDGKINAFFNVCMHRGRQLTEGCGHLTQFQCRYHGWRYDLDGRCTRVVDRVDWGDRLTDADIALRSVKVGTWGGFVFINCDPNAQPLEEFLQPVIERVSQFEIEKMRFFSYRTVRYPCNWKVFIEGFDEAYHAQQSHPQLIELIKDNSRSRVHGWHGNLYWDISTVSRFGPADRLNKTPDPDHRKYVLQYHKEIVEQLGAMTTPRTYEALQRLQTEVPDTATPAQVMLKARQFQREAAEADGVTLPQIAPEYMAASGFNWHVFPNVVFQHQGLDSLLFYRARPDGTSPDSCLMDIWSLMRYGPGKEPKLKREFFNDWRQAKLGRILDQDFINLHAVQKGMKSRGFTAARPNPMQETSVSNLHRGLRRFMSTAGEKAAPGIPARQRALV
jgi:phenylpropionate dioxygenase-like ring-hydroxylating dioxygenase large terminal subunit